jgi:putative FmdB family regulatory protein
MPTYSYRCTECGTAFDIQQAFTDDSLTVCLNCGGKLRKLFHAVGVSFSGSGFYRNDSRAGETKAREKKESAGSDAAPASAPKETAAAPAASGSSTPAAAPKPEKKSAPAKKE